MIHVNLKSGEKTEVLQYLDKVVGAFDDEYFEELPDEKHAYKETLRRGVRFLLTGDRENKEET